MFWLHFLLKQGWRLLFSWILWYWSQRQAGNNDMILSNIEYVIYVYTSARITASIHTALGERNLLQVCVMSVPYSVSKFRSGMQTRKDIHLCPRSRLTPQKQLGFFNSTKFNFSTITWDEEKKRKNGVLNFFPADYKPLLVSISIQLQAQTNNNFQLGRSI